MGSRLLTAVALPEGAATTLVIVMAGCSIAITLGAKKVAKRAYEWCAQHEVVSHVLSDRAAVADAAGQR